MAPQSAIRKKIVEGSVGDHHFNGVNPPPQIVEDNKNRKQLAGFLVVCALAISHCGTAQFAQRTFIDPKFYAPFFLTWFSTSSMMLCFPVAVFLVAYVRRSKSTLTLRQLLEQETKTMFGTDAQKRQALLVCGAFTLLWVLSNYAYVRGLATISSSAASAVFSSNIVFVFLLSAVFLGSKPISLKLISVALAVFGLFAFSDGFQLAPGGVAMILCSAFVLALFTVTFKRFIGEQGTLVQVALLLSAIGALNCSVLSYFLCIADHAEEMRLHRIPWFFVIGMSTGNLAFSFLFNYGVAITNPLFIALGMTLGIPLNAFVNTIVNGEAFGPLKVVGAIALIVAFVTATLLPDSLDCNKMRQKIVVRRAPSPSSLPVQAR